MSRIMFCKYGNRCDHISLDELLAENKESGCLWAHAEDSGSESCYAEVAKWSDSRRRWERYAFVKCLDYRLDYLPDASDVETACAICNRINNAGYDHGRARVIAGFPGWQPESASAPQVVDA